MTLIQKQSPSNTADPQKSAITSVFCAVNKNGPVRLADVVRLTGVVEIHAQRALKTLTEQRFLTRTKDGYRVVR